ncbi:hypothetical protein Rsub_12540 [Raphidocelis subcapitata]|uniref:Uncharacterized protein n=1 Tax=Raphidocelis subcapitata TaxID=307507 RepID=A0A2V0PP90_9CHLO|nr:hypothetical protein Rsub_12540 [Raphidocelis subcapitata]|eukprot:GBF99840.1 hypothetical protein Rsub_12540 [Raphidocelis subcapitata]
MICGSSGGSAARRRARRSAAAASTREASAPAGRGPNRLILRSSVAECGSCATCGRLHGRSFLPATRHSPRPFTRGHTSKGRAAKKQLCRSRTGGVASCGRAPHAAHAPAASSALAQGGAASAHVTLHIDRNAAQQYEARARLCVPGRLCTSCDPGAAAVRPVWVGGCNRFVTWLVFRCSACQRARTGLGKECLGAGQGARRQGRGAGYYCCVSTPLLLAMRPARRSSTSHARRSARAKALKVASTMWWLLRPASWRMCSVVPEVLAKLMKKCSTSSVSNAPMRCAGMARSQLRWARPDRSSTTCVSASSSGAVNSPKRWMPARSPSACDSAPPSASAVSSTVWWSSIQVSPSAAT